MLKKEIRTLVKKMRGTVSREFFDHAHERLSELLERNGLTLSEFGISTEELRTLRQKACLATALFWLNRLRKGVPEQYDNYISYLRHELSEGGYALNDPEIGSSEEEIALCRVRCRELTALRYLREMRKTFMQYGYVNACDLTSFGEEVADDAHPLSFKKLGTTSVEVEKFTSMKTRNPCVKEHPHMSAT